MLKELGERIGRWSLKRELARREEQAMEFSDRAPRTAWILYMMDGADSFHAVTELEERLKKELGVQEVRCFADLMGDEVPDFAMGARDTDFIRRSEQSWTGKWKGGPSGTEASPDLLIDLSDGRSLALDRLKGELSDSLRIGRYRNDRLPHYDLMIESEEDEGIHDLGERILRYLTLMIKKEG